MLSLFSVGLHTRSYKIIQDHTRSYKIIQDHTRSYNALLYVCQQERLILVPYTVAYIHMSNRH